jgi:hypothetical protein
MGVSRLACRRAGLLVLALLTGSVLVWWWVLTPVRGYAAGGAVSATMTPEQVTLSPGGSVTGLLTLVNGGAVRVRVGVRPVGSDPSVQIVMPRRAVTLAAGESVSLEFTIARVAEGSGQDVVASFVVSAPLSSTVAAVMVKAAASPAVVDVKVESNVDRINENRPGSAILVISNPRETAVRVTSLAVTAPTSTTVTARCPGQVVVSAADGATTDGPACTFTVGGRQQQVLPVTFAAPDLVVPGARSATFQVRAHEVGTAAAVVEMVATVPFTVEVFGESDILKAVGVPVFLVLPGVIIVLTAWFLIGRLTPWPAGGGSAGGGDAGGVVGAASRTAILGLAVSLVVAKVYPALTARLVPGRRRDYLHAYGFLDFYYVFLYSFLIAVAVWIVAWLGYLGRRGMRALFVPRPGDTAPALLRKIGIRGIFGGGTTFTKAQAAGLGGVVLRRRSSGAALLAPRIIVTVRKPGGADNDIDDLAAGNHAVRLWWAVRGPRTRHRFAVHYRPEDIPAVAEVEEPDVGQQIVAIVQIGQPAA